MEEMRDDTVPSGRGSSNATLWPSAFVEKFGSISLGSKEETLTSKDSPRNHGQDGFSPSRASHVLWSTGMLSEPIPNCFYSVVPYKSLRQRFNTIPTLDELNALGDEGLKADVILVDFQKDKKLFMLKQLIVTLVRGLNSNPATIVKKITGLVTDLYKRTTLQSPSRTALNENAQSSESRGIQLLGQIKHGSCRPRAILFKVLADTVGLESRLLVGLPSDGAAECVDSYKHMSVLVVLNSVEMLVDLMRFPGQLIPLSTKAIFMTHISAAGEGDSVENDSCDSPLEPSSPLCDHESAEKDENLPFQRNITLRRAPTLERKLSFSRSEPNIATAFLRRSQRRIVEQRAASSSPEHPSFRTRTRSILSGERNSVREFNDDVVTSSYKSDETPKAEAKRTRRRSISVTPEIGDDIVRAVRAMNEALKQKRFLREQGDNAPLPNSSDDRTGSPHLLKNGSGFHLDAHDQVSGGRSTSYSRLDPQKAVSLPSSPQNFRRHSSERIEPPHHNINNIWNKVLESPMFQNKPLLPYEEWSIDFSELTVGTRVGIGFFGEVFRGIWNGTDVAVKVFLEQDFTVENMEDFCNEISILSRLRHPNVILFMGACTRPPRLSLVTEYMEMGSLYYLIHMSGHKTKFSWRRKLKMLRDICRGLMCIHRMKIVHRDLKSANCLVNKHWTVKICDFGLSRIMTDTATVRETVPAGTPEWMAPELIRNEPFSEKSDIFSLGVIMWELCTLSKPWEGVPPERVVYAVAKEGSRLEIPEGPLGKLIADCWAEPQQRPSCEEILSRLLDCEYSLC
ncbi:PREDICTED: serine/threonine-protein kinase EDR1 [Tarenaya hassleriana]|uniref:serine/threonine-protein kinase EDR1 n=1 Tax=Tarenaya hassleriana TaxID=28532 RepID=UPI00053C4092|nr:PREDICTED: serine/threonine-protein kinase EDR1 [Tarenaya hassleriana]XP_010525070.1 PREDICTED: serine/threonine-protein kinase EDR1 [Tarenaya hassleriana]